jgi:penicillin amidase
LLDEVKNVLLSWDGFQTEESPEAAAFGFFWLSLAEAVYRDQLHAESWPPSSQHRLFNSMYYLLQDPDNIWWDNRTSEDRIEDRDEILRRSFILGMRTAADRLGDDFSSWRWGRVHTVEFRNQTLGESGIGVIERIFNRGPFPLRAGATQVFQAGWSYDDPFIVTVIPSMRQIIDIGDLSTGLMIHPTGQSGHPGHQHYDDFIDDWRTVRYHSSRWEREAVEKASRERLLLLPEGDGD